MVVGSRRREGIVIWACICLKLLCLDDWLAGWLVLAWYIYIYYHSLKGGFVVKR